VGYDAIAVRGAGLVSNPTTVDALAEWLVDRVAVVAGDGDPAGQKFSVELTAALAERGVVVKMLPMPAGKDVTDLRADDPAWFKQGFVKQVKEATTTTAEGARDAEWDEEVYALSDVGAARRLRDWLDARGQPVRYTGAMGFLQYRGGVWQRLGNEQVRTLAHEVGDFLTRRAQRLYREAKRQESDRLHREAGRVNAYAMRAQLSVGVDSIVKELKSVTGVFVEVSDFDRHPYLLAARNGVIDLRTSALLAHDPSLMLTRRVEYDFDPEARAPRWIQFLHEVFPDQPDMPDFLQRLVGYGITGSTDEQCFVVNYGTGSNGKSLFTDTLTDVFRAITTTTPFSTFEAKQSGGIPNDLAALNGARMVMASEGEQNRPMAEAVLKRITGRDMVSARFLNREFFEFRPMFLLWMSSNYRPAFKGQDEGLWRRVRLLEWRRQFKASERDPGLPAKLASEGAGILAWAVAGAALWSREGLNEPASVRDVTDSYRVQSDVLTGFLPGEWERGDQQDWVPRTDLFRAFQDYAEQENMGDLAKWSSRAFYRAIEERGFPAGKRNGVLGFRNIRRSEDPVAAAGHEEPRATMEVKTTPGKGPTLEDFDA
jgi:putative DNA primase/helicase